MRKKQGGQPLAKPDFVDRSSPAKQTVRFMVALRMKALLKRAKSIAVRKPKDGVETRK
jgi:hypothetical protein